MVSPNAKHRIADISFSGQIVICICGWQGHGKELYDLWKDHLGIKKRGLR